MIQLLYILFVPFQVNNRIMRCFQFIKLETAPLTNNKGDVARIISVCGVIFRILFIHVAKFIDEEFTICMPPLQCTFTHSMKKKALDAC